MAGVAYDLDDVAGEGGVFVKAATAAEVAEPGFCEAEEGKF